MNVSLFVTCLGEIFYQDAAKDVVEVLERLGCNVDLPRGQAYELDAVFDNEDTHKWNPAAGRENIGKAEVANVGVFFSDISLAESGTVVQFNDRNIARSVSLLPAVYIAIVPKASIVPRMTQAMYGIHKQAVDGEEISTCINFISGPSNSADIEMNIVEGVHGPVKAVYLVVDR